MGAGSFSKDMSNLFESATTLTDDGSVTGYGKNIFILFFLQN